MYNWITQQYLSTEMEESIHLDKRKKLWSFFIHQFNIRFGHLKEPSHAGGSCEHPQQMIWLVRKLFF